MTTVQKQSVRETPFLFRALWFAVVGWHAAGFWIAIAWILNVTIIGLPAGLWMLNRVPQVLTLKAAKGDYIQKKSGETTFHSKRQMPFLIRALYFVVFGWWVSFLWAAVGYLLCLSIVGLPFGLLMLNRLPFVTTLRQ